MCSAAGGASGIAARAAAEHCARIDRSYCRIPAACLLGVATARARGRPDSNTAPSNRANTASVIHLDSLANSSRKPLKPPVAAGLPGKMMRLSGRGTCVSRGIHTISSGIVAKGSPGGWIRARGKRGAAAMPFQSKALKSRYILRRVVAIIVSVELRYLKRRAWLAIR